MQYLPPNSPLKLIFYSENFSSSSTNYQGGTLRQNGTKAVDFGRYEEYQVYFLDKEIHVFCLWSPICWKLSGRVRTWPSNPSVPTNQITSCRRSLSLPRASYSSYVNAISAHIYTCGTLLLHVILIRAPPYREHLCGDDMTYTHHHTSSR